jgi:hypothetical protein
MAAESSHGRAQCHCAAANEKIASTSGDYKTYLVLECLLGLIIR